MSHRDLDRVRTFSRRAALLGGGKLALVATLVGRLYYLQVIEADRYRVLAEENRINLRLLPPPRGRIFDRNGEPLAENRLNYRVVMISEQAGDIATTLEALGRLIPLSEYEVRRVLREARRKRAFVPIMVRENLSWPEVARVEVNVPELPGVMIDVGQSRHYPHGEIAAHVTGYVAAVSERDQTGDPLLELPDFRIGKNGIERAYDLALRGSAGNSQVEVNAYGRVIRELARDDGQPGDDLTLTLDIGLQRYAAARIAEESAAAAVLDIHSGEVLSLVSTPSFDPNAFNTGLSHAAWKALIENPRKPLVDKAIGGQYPPGSTFKMVVALAALEAGIVGPYHNVTCRGFVRLGNATFHCWKRGGHGELRMVEAIEQSCDVYFYDIARRVGIERIAEMARRFGLGTPSGIDLPNERGGLVPDDDWKRANFDTPWQKGETLVVGIGQGYLLATPVQLAMMTARLANGGRAITPHLAERAAGQAVEPPPSLGIDPASLAVVLEGMDRVVNGRRGTARAARLGEDGMTMAGKTGTSQVRRIGKAERLSGVRKNEEKPWEERDHALFVGFAPVAAPRYAVAVVVEHGGSGAKAAAPVARDLMRETLRRAPAGGPGRLAAAEDG